MQIVGMRSIVHVAIPILALTLAGCQMEQWDWFGNKQNKNTRSGSKARRPVQPVAKGSEPPAAAGTDEAKARAADERINAHYAKRTDDPAAEPAYYDDGITGKMERQNDPQRRQRIQKTASNAYAPPGAEPTARDRPAEDDTPELASRNDAPPTRVVSARGANNESLRNPEPVAPARPRDDPTAVELANATETPTTAKPTPDQTPATGGAAATSAKTTPPAPANTPPANVASAMTANTAPRQPVANDPNTGDAGARRPRQPALASVDVSAAPEQEQPRQSTKRVPDNLRANTTPKPAAEPVDTFNQRIADLEAIVALQPNDIEAQFRLRMLYLADGRDDKALETTDGMNADLVEIVEAHFQALIAARSGTGRDPALWADSQLAAIERLHQRVRARADLQVPKVLLCTAIDGYGIYEPIDPPQFPAGRVSQAILYIEVENFKTERIDSGPNRGLYQTSLTVRRSLFDRSGKEIWSKTDENIRDLSRGQRRDFFLTAPVDIPSALGAGEYVLKVEVEDDLAGKINSNSVRFEMTLR